MHFAKQIFNDFLGIIKVCGILTAIRWIIFIFLSLPECIRRKNLQPADKKFGQGPILIRAKYGNVKLSGGQIFSSIREIWVRNVYLRDNFIKIPQEGIVVDLGANVGGFTMLALSNSKNCKVIAVEPNIEFNRLLLHQVNDNNLNDRLTLLNYFVGSPSVIQEEMLKSYESKDSIFISQKEFINLNKLNRIDFLKCDIEGSEFDFINDTSLLAITKQLAIEIHDSAGDRNEFIKKLEELNFQISPIKDDGESCILLAKK